MAMAIGLEWCRSYAWWSRSQELEHQPRALDLCAHGHCNCNADAGVRLMLTHGGAAATTRMHAHCKLRLDSRTPGLEKVVSCSHHPRRRHRVIMHATGTERNVYLFYSMQRCNNHTRTSVAWFNHMHKKRIATARRLSACAHLCVQALDFLSLLQRPLVAAQPVLGKLVAALLGGRAAGFEDIQNTLLVRSQPRHVTDNFTDNLDAL